MPPEILSMPGAFVVPSVEVNPTLQPSSDGRMSKFKDLNGFVTSADRIVAKFVYRLGREFTYAQVGGIYYVEHEKDDEINHRVVVIVRTNNDSWSCYGFCKHPNSCDTDNPEFKHEHAEVILQVPAQRENTQHENTRRRDIQRGNTQRGNTQCGNIQRGNTQRDNMKNVPPIVIQDDSGNDLNVELHLWINCRQVLDIKHTVRMARIGSVRDDSLAVLLQRGKDIFNRTFGDCDKHQSTNSRALCTYRQQSVILVRKGHLATSTFAEAVNCHIGHY